ncbi:hypothetical protein RDABS01_025481 [Bienertia sinuspersici]
MARDFNDTRYEWERSSSSRDSNRRAARFNYWINDLELLEVEFSGASHTWSSGNSVETWKSARLDRALCNGDWSCRFENAHVKHLPAIRLDHCPLLISPNGFAPLNALNKPFRFQGVWLSHEKFQDFVEEKWDKGCNLITSLKTKGNPGPGGGGGIIRDSDGWFITAFSARYGITNAFRVELRAIYRGLRLARELQIPKLEVQVDNKACVQVLTDNRTPTGEYANLIQACRNLKNEDGWTVRTIHVGLAL